MGVAADPGTEVARLRALAARLEAENRALVEALAVDAAARNRIESIYHGYFENTAEALFIVGVAEDGEDFFVEALNPAHEATFGFRSAETAGRRLHEILPADVAELLAARYRACVEAGAPVRYEETARLPLGGRVWETVLVPLRDERGRIVRVLGSSRDLTERRRAEEQLRQSQKMEAIGQLTGGVAHDFNNLLTVIRGNLEMAQLKAAEAAGDGLRRYLANAATAANRAAALTHRLLTFARKQPLDPRTIDVRALVDSLADLLPQTLGPEVEVRFDLPDNLWACLCDPNQLENALLNLAVNARDAMPQGGMLTVAARNVSLAADTATATAAGDYVRLSVSDTGQGMAPEVLARAFEPFFTTKPVGRGTGLGLSMLYGFVRQSGGRVTIDSAPGRGTTVEIDLPRAAPVLAAEGDGVEQGQQQTSTARGKVLVVEDEVLVQMLVLEVLSDLGLDALEANDGPSALAILQSDAEIDLLITDVGLPGMNGRQLAEQGRAGRPGLKVLFVTGYADKVNAGQLAGDGMQTITKPFALDHLAQKVTDMLGGAAE